MIGNGNIHKRPKMLFLFLFPLLFFIILMNTSLNLTSLPLVLLPFVLYPMILVKKLGGNFIFIMNMYINFSIFVVFQAKVQLEISI